MCTSLWPPKRLAVFSLHSSFKSGRVNDDKDCEHSIVSFTPLSSGFADIFIGQIHNKRDGLFWQNSLSNDLTVTRSDTVDDRSLVSFLGVLLRPGITGGHSLRQGKTWVLSCGRCPPYQKNHNIWQSTSYD